MMGVVALVLLAFVASRRGWAAVFTIAVLCIGIGLGQTAVGQGLYRGVTTGLSATWQGVTSGMQAVIR